VDKLHQFLSVLARRVDRRYYSFK